jgi:thiol-disulfide isomerase/thioredoxin
MGLSDWCSNLNKTYILIGILVILIAILLLLNHQKSNKIYGRLINNTPILPSPIVYTETIPSLNIPAESIKKPESFSGSISGEKPVMILYYASWCGWCKKIKPVWEQLKETVKNNPELNNKVIITEIQCDVENPPEKAKKINGYPTIILEHNGKEISYEGDRTIEAFTEFIKNI